MTQSNITPNEQADDCKLCGGSGEVEIEMPVTAERNTVGCPGCIERQLTERIAELEKQLLAQQYLTATATMTTKQQEQVFAAVAQQAGISQPSTNILELIQASCLSECTDVDCKGCDQLLHAIGGSKFWQKERVASVSVDARTPQDYAIERGKKLP
jgi:hypothetical protein